MPTQLKSDNTIVLHPVGLAGDLSCASVGQMGLRPSDCYDGERQGLALHALLGHYGSCLAQNHWTDAFV